MLVPYARSAPTIRMITAVFHVYLHEAGQKQLEGFLAKCWCEASGWMWVLKQGPGVCNQSDEQTQVIAPKLYRQSNRELFPHVVPAENKNILSLHTFAVRWSQQAPVVGCPFGESQSSASPICICALKTPNCNGPTGQELYLGHLNWLLHAALAGWCWNKPKKKL